MDAFLQAVQLISDNRFWVMPLLAIVALAVLVREVFTVLSEEMEAMRRTGRTDDR